MRTTPWCAEEHVFAERFGQRGKGFKPHTTERQLRDSHMRMTPGAIETLALTELEAGGSWGVHSENALALGLAGLAFWDAVFAPVSGAFTNLFQTGPNDLWWDDFAANRAEYIDAQTECMQHAAQPLDLLLATHRAKVGLANPLVHWSVLTEEVLVIVGSALSAQQLVALVRYVIANLKFARTGFPDLAVVHPDGRAEFVEVKGPNDTLQPQQRYWFEKLHALGIEASVLKYKA